MDFSDVLAIIVALALIISIALSLVLVDNQKKHYDTLPKYSGVVRALSLNENYFTGKCDPTIDLIVSAKDGEEFISFRKTYHVTLAQYTDFDLGDIVDFENNEPIFDKE